MYSPSYYPHIVSKYEHLFINHTYYLFIFIENAATIKAVNIYYIFHQIAVIIIIIIISLQYYYWNYLYYLVVLFSFIFLLTTFLVVV